MKRERKRKLALWILSFYWLLLFIGTTLPSDNLPDMPSGDKVNHFVGYAILSFLLFIFLRIKNYDSVLEMKIFQKTFIITVVYGILDEIHQIPIPGRYFDWYDMLANFEGVTLGLCFAFILSRTYPKLFK